MYNASNDIWADDTTDYSADADAVPVNLDAEDRRTLALLDEFGIGDVEVVNDTSIFDTPFYDVG